MRWAIRRGWTMWSKRWPAITDDMRGRWFFFYGTLAHDHHNDLTRAIMPVLEGGQRACVRGQLRAVRAAGGWYPILCAGQGRVIGRLYRAGRRFGAKHLGMLDAYEDFDARRADRSEYRRQPVWVRIAGGSGIMAQVYGYNRPVHGGLRIIPGGDFAAYAARAGLVVFGATD